MRREVSNSPSCWHPRGHGRRNSASAARCRDAGLGSAGCQRSGDLVRGCSNLKARMTSFHPAGGKAVKGNEAIASKH